MNAHRAFVELNDIDVQYMSELDSNRLALAERLMPQIAANTPDADSNEIADIATRVACENIPSARQAAIDIAEMKKGPTFCYLGFYGMRGTAHFLKVGISRHPERRLLSIATNNPLDCIAFFTAPLPTLAIAYHVEQSLLRQLAHLSVRGEWLQVGDTSPNAALALARQLSRAAQDVCGCEMEFELHKRAA